MYDHDFHYIEECLSAIHELINEENCSDLIFVMKIQTEEITRNSLEIELCIDLLQDLKEYKGKTREELWEKIKAWTELKVSIWLNGFQTYYQWCNWDGKRIVLYKK